MFTMGDRWIWHAGGHGNHEQGSVPSHAFWTRWTEIFEIDSINMRRLVLMTSYRPIPGATASEAPAHNFQAPRYSRFTPLHCYKWSEICVGRPR